MPFSQTSHHEVYHSHFVVKVTLRDVYSVDGRSLSPEESVTYVLLILSELTNYPRRIAVSQEKWLNPEALAVYVIFFFIYTEL